MDSVRVVEDWPVERAAAIVVDATGRVLGAYGPIDQEFELASVTKLLTAYATLIAVEEGAIEWDQPAGPPGSTVRHLIAHTSGLAFTEHKIMAPPGERRLYSNAGFEVLGAVVAEATGISFAAYVSDAVLKPLGMADSRMVGTSASGAVSTAEDLCRFAVELQVPRLVAPSTMADARAVQFPGLTGVLPGFGHMRPNDWGLGFELRDHKRPHWTGAANSPETFGHFGQSGTFLWVDPVAGLAAVVLTDRIFGEWAKKAWPAFADAVLTETRVNT